MTDAAIIAAQLVDIRNVGSHKVVKLTLHAPEEHAMAIMKAFGWPTMVAPVPVALARLNTKGGDDGEPSGSTSVRGVSDRNVRDHIEQVTTYPPLQDSVTASAGADKPKKSPAQIAGYLCTQISFQKFLRERFPEQWREAMDVVSDLSEDIGQDAAADTVRMLCNVHSRADIKPNSPEWLSLQLEWKLWIKRAEVVPV